MRGKLSQTVRGLISLEQSVEQWEGRGMSPITTSGLGLILFVAALIASGCEGSGSGTTAATSPNADESSFEWPEDSSHPILRIDIDGAAGSGAIEIELMPELAPKTVAQIVEWAEDGYFDGTTFHRVIKDFMIQGGDPNTRDKVVTNDGLGGPGFSLDDEFSDAPFLRGVVGMGNTGRRNSAGSQFFITQADAHHLDGSYTVIGRVRSGMEFVDAIVDVEIDTVGRWGPRARPIEDVVMARVRPLDRDSTARITAVGSVDAADQNEPLSATNHAPTSNADVEDAEEQGSATPPAALAP
jgi:peptidyl-prolyl cis-trans isomerase B (cyclophilin B)